MRKESNNMARLNKWEEEHLRNMAAYERQIDRVFLSAAREAAMLATVAAGKFNQEKPFSFKDYPATRKRLEHLLSELKDGITAVVVNGVNSEWTLANNKNNELANQVFGDNVGKLSDEQYRRYYRTNDNARTAFVERKTAGMNLSDRVWRYTEQFKAEIEMGIDIGLRDGTSADELSRELRKYLRYPDKLFRRVRDEHGVLRLSKAAKAFHPGQGVYRSSYKNARRLTATETNMAYRTADYVRWQQLDFVVGIEIRLSNNHTLNGVPFEDICDELKGKYPKDFKFTGWHPHCRCHAVTILKTEEEMAEDNRRILAGEPVSEGSVNTVTEVPQKFKDWLEDNRERMARAKSLPYFLRDNWKYVTQVATVQKQPKFEELIKELKAVGIASVPVQALTGEATLECIVKRVGGGDKTDGSCASLCLAFVGNRCGMSVLDFRGGQSQTTFALRSTWDKINKAVGGIKEVGKDDFAMSSKLLATITEGKEYILLTGGHAAVVRKSAAGYEYLELQSSYDNGYKKLDNYVLKHRFCAKKRTQYVSSTFIIEVDKFKEISDLRDMLGYINTAASKQQKGKGGSTK